MPDWHPGLRPSILSFDNLSRPLPSLSSFPDQARLITCIGVYIDLAILLNSWKGPKSIVCSPFLPKPDWHLTQTVTWVGVPTQTWPGPNISTMVKTFVLSLPPSLFLARLALWARLSHLGWVGGTLDLAGPQPAVLHLLATSRPPTLYLVRTAYYVNSQTHKLFVLGIFSYYLCSIFIYSLLLMFHVNIVLLCFQNISCQKSLPRCCLIIHSFSQ